MGRKQLTLDDDAEALLEELAEESTNNNSTRLVSELVERAEQARHRTGKDDALAALDDALNRLPESDGVYNPFSDDYELSSDEIREIVERDPVRKINPDHVHPPEIRGMSTWCKAGLLAGMMMYMIRKYDVEGINDVIYTSISEDGECPWSLVEDEYDDLKMLYLGERTRVSDDIVRRRFDAAFGVELDSKKTHSIIQEIDSIIEHKSLDDNVRNDLGGLKSVLEDICSVVEESDREVYEGYTVSDIESKIEDVEEYIEQG